MGSLKFNLFDVLYFCCSLQQGQSESAVRHEWLRVQDSAQVQDYF